METLPVSLSPIAAMQKNRVAANHFNLSTGYGYDDEGRDTLERVYADCFGTETVPLDQITDAVLSVFDLRPAAIIRDLDLLRPIYSLTTNYGQFGRELPEFTWERTDRADALAKAVKG